MRLVVIPDKSIVQHAVGRKGQHQVKGHGHDLPQQFLVGQPIGVAGEVAHGFPGLVFAQLVAEKEQVVALVKTIGANFGQLLDALPRASAEGGFLPAVVSLALLFSVRI